MHYKTVAVAGCFLLSVICMCFLYLAGGAFQNLLFNSDALYLPVLFKDIIQNGGSISDWYPTPAP